MKNVVQDGETLSYDAIAELLCVQLECSAYVLDSAGKVLGYALQDGLECEMLYANVTEKRRFLSLVKKMLRKAEGIYSICHNDCLCPFQEDLRCTDPERQTVVVPICFRRKQTGLLLLMRNSQGFREEELLLAEYAAAVIGYRLALDKEVIRLQESEKKMMVQSGLSVLSYSEWRGIVCLFSELNGIEGIVVTDKVAKQTGTSRSAIITALRKLTSANLVQTNNMGSKGLRIKIKNEFLLEEIRNRCGTEEEDELSIEGNTKRQEIIKLI